MFDMRERFGTHTHPHIQVYYHGSIEDRWSKRSVVSTHAISLHLASSFYEMCIYTMTGKALEFYAHHVLVITSCGSFLLFRRGHLWCCWLGLVEGTNPALCSLTALGQIPSMKGGSLYVVSGAMLWVTYVFCRMISSPWCM